MTEQQAKKRVHPTILTRARELRRGQTPQEQKLWQRLRNKQLYGLKFRRQHPIHRFILDFYCHQHGLVVEIDGHGHANPEQQRILACHSEEQRDEESLRCWLAKFLGISLCGRNDMVTAFL